MKLHIAITGGSGRLGRHVVRALAAHRPRELDLAPRADSSAEFHPADLRDLGALTSALQGIEVVVHLGASTVRWRLTPPPRCRSGP
jgi:UDP-glucose 4-epimerase